MTAAATLPPVRELARTLAVSPATVAAAYRLLRARGLTAAQGRRGTRVVPRTHSASGQLRPSPSGTIDLATGNPDPTLLPPMDAALRELDPSPRLYDLSPQLPALAQFVVSEFQADGLPVTRVTLVGGALDAIDRILREHLRPGDRVAVEDPCFPSVHALLVASGYLPVPVALDADGMQVESLASALAKKCQALIVTPRAQNPSGAALTPARAAALQGLLRSHPDLLLVEDDPCGPVAGTPLVTLCEGTRLRWAHVKSTAKFLGPDLRMAFVAGDALTLDRVAGRYAIGPRRVSLLLQQLVFRLWSDPGAGRQLARASTIYQQRRDALVRALADRGVMTHAASGFNVWVPLRHETHVVADMAERGWAVAPGEPFRLRAAPGIRITTAALLPADAARLADNLVDVITPAARPSA